MTQAPAGHRHRVAPARRLGGRHDDGGFRGRLAGLAACGSSTRQARVQVRKGRFAVHLGLPKGCGKNGRVRVTVSWAGSATFAKASATKSVRTGR